MASPVDFALFTRLLPLAIGAAVSPMVLVFQLLNLSSPRRGLARSGAFLLGCMLVVTLWLLCAGWIAALLPPAVTGPDPFAAAFDALFALLLLALGVRILTQAPPATPQLARHGLWTPALGGLGDAASTDDQCWCAAAVGGGSGLAGPSQGLSFSSRGSGSTSCRVVEPRLTAPSLAARASSTRVAS